MASPFDNVPVPEPDPDAEPEDLPLTDADGLDPYPADAPVAQDDLAGGGP